MTTDSPPSRRQGSARSAFWAWVALIAFSVFLRLYNPYSFGDDEHMHLNIASAPSLADVVRYSFYETHPPLFYILLHGWMQVSDNPFFIRCFALFFGLSLLPVYYLIGRQLGGKSCGMACLTLVALSPALIHQSQLMRHYGVLLLFISLGFYAWLRWSETLKHRFLLAYLLFGCLAALTHFTAMFFVICLGPFGLYQLLRKQAAALFILEWTAANSAILLLSLWLYDLWQPSVLRYFDFFSAIAPALPGEPARLILNALLSPLSEMNYIYPFIPVLPLAILSGLSRRSEPALRPYLLLAALGCFASILLYLSGLYTVTGTRHNVWLLPFFIPLCGVVIAHHAARWDMTNMPLLLACIAIITGYETGQSFTGEKTDYQTWGLNAWPSSERALNQLGSRDVIIPDRGSINLLLNPYEYMDDAHFLNPVLAPWKGNRIVVSPQLIRALGTMHVMTLTTASLLPSLTRMLPTLAGDGVERIVFFKSWSSTFYDLLTCPALAKDILYMQDGGPRPESFAVIAIRREVLEKDLLPPAGKAHACLASHAGAK